MNLNCDASVMLELVNSLASLKDLQRDIIKTEMNDDAPYEYEKKPEKIIEATHNKNYFTYATMNAMPTKLGRPPTTR